MFNKNHFIVFFIGLFTIVYFSCDTNYDGIKTPSLGDFIIGNLEQMVGNLTAVTIVPKDEKSQGKITIYYNESTTLPTTGGVIFCYF